MVRDGRRAGGGWRWMRGLRRGWRAWPGGLWQVSNEKEKEEPRFRGTRTRGRARQRKRERRREPARMVKRAKERKAEERRRSREKGTEEKGGREKERSERTANGVRTERERRREDEGEREGGRREKVIDAPCACGWRTWLDKGRVYWCVAYVTRMCMRHVCTGAYEAAHEAVTYTWPRIEHGPVCVVCVSL